MCDLMKSDAHRGEKDRLVRREPTLDPNCTTSLFRSSYGQILALFPNWECPLADGETNGSRTHMTRAMTHLLLTLRREAKAKASDFIRARSIARVKKIKRTITNVRARARDVFPRLTVTLLFFRLLQHSRVHGT